MFSSYRVRLIFSHLGVIILAMGASGVLLLSTLQQYFLQATEESLLTQAHITAGVLIPGAVSSETPVEDQNALSNAIQQQQVGNIALQAENVTLPPGEIGTVETDLSYLTEASLQLGAQLDTRIRVLDASGVLLVDSLGEDGGLVLDEDPLITQALRGEVSTRTDQGGDDPAMHLALPVTVEGSLVGVVYLSQPLDDVTEVLGDLRTRLLGSTAIAMLVASLVSLPLSEAIARPLRRLTAAAGAVAQGRFDQQVPVRSRDELGRLGRAFNDMTSRLRSARQTQIDFVADVSHELRTPLTSVKGMLETLRDGAVEDPEVRDDFLETVDLETDRLIRLVNDLLVLSRADSEALNLKREIEDLVDVVDRVLERMKPAAEQKDVRVKLEAGSRRWAVWVDVDRIQQVLVNLLDNAVKYSRLGGLVIVRIAEHKGGMLRVEVCDDGIGIPPENLEQIGRRFYRADKARTRERGGSGLGLAIAQALVEAHGGELWVESKEGVGTTVRFTLPVSDLS
jgi:signal transduction histidine kinase